jgi:hypothetical protein
MIYRMADGSFVPASVTVRILFADLLGREVIVSPGEPLGTSDLPRLVVALFVDDHQQLVAVIGMDLSLAAYASAAMGLLPPDAADDSIEANHLTPTLAENVGELCNILTTLLNRDGSPHVRLHQVMLPGDKAPNDAAAQLLALGRRLDLDVEITRYGGGRFAVSMVSVES